MIVTCEECQTRFLLDPKLIGEKGRTVKCAKCSHTWFQEKPEDLPEVETQEAPEEVKPIPKGSSLPVVQEKVKPGVLALQIACGVMLFANILGVLFFSTSFGKSIFGLHDSKSLVFQSVQTKKMSYKETKRLLVKGSVLNESEEGIQAPYLKVTLLDKDQQLLDSFKQPLSKDSAVIDPQSIYDFRSRIKRLPEDTAYLSLGIGNAYELMRR